MSECQTSQIHNLLYFKFSTYVLSFKNKIIVFQPNTGVFSTATNQPNSTNQIWLQQQQQLRQQRSPSLELPKFSIYQSASTTSVASQLFQQPISNSELSGAQQLLKSTVEIRTDRDVNNSGFNDTDDAFSHRVKERRDS